MRHHHLSRILFLVFAIAAVASVERELRAPFGGVGDSGIGREGGDYSREFFTEPKAVVIEP